MDELNYKKLDCYLTELNEFDNIPIESNLKDFENLHSLLLNIYDFIKNTVELQEEAGKRTKYFDNLQGEEEFNDILEKLKNLIIQIFNCINTNKAEFFQKRVIITSIKKIDKEIETIVFQKTNILNYQEKVLNLYKKSRLRVYKSKKRDFLESYNFYKGTIDIICDGLGLSFYEKANIEELVKNYQDSVLYWNNLLLIAEAKIFSLSDVKEYFEKLSFDIKNTEYLNEYYSRVIIFIEKLKKNSNENINLGNIFDISKLDKNMDEFDSLLKRLKEKTIENPLMLSIKQFRNFENKPNDTDNCCKKIKEARTVLNDLKSTIEKSQIIKVKNESSVIFELNNSIRLLTLYETNISLTENETQLLYKLALNPNNCLKYNELVETDEDNDDAYLKNRLAQGKRDLEKKIKNELNNIGKEYIKPIIKVITGKGYTLNLKPEEIKII